MCIRDRAGVDGRCGTSSIPGRTGSGGGEMCIRDRVVPDFIAGFPRQHFLDEGELLLKGLALDEFRAQFFQGAEFTHGGAVKWRVPGCASSPECC